MSPDKFLDFLFQSAITDLIKEITINRHFYRELYFTLEKRRYGAWSDVLGFQPVLGNPSQFRYCGILVSKGE